MQQSRFMTLYCVDVTFAR